ncbi:hypothetical protein A9Q84_09725 [Halobacteriovorax marinus]|uniref:Uncharacterized protein n=1 Tax=Halobacteriovorax marinus TaxID=97084 RepID=A0A1Y5F740_9BACT|nr:hypothetical protein A9Q84_09725 [Halobacteriovorax marinus]
MYFEFLGEVDKFCSCQAKHLKKDEIEKRRDYFKWSFKDKKIQFAKEDQCIIENFSPHAIHTFYTISLDTRLRKHLNLRIHHRFPNSTHFLASEQSVVVKLNCLEEKILKKCSKVKSLRSTYNCIQSMTDRQIQFDKIERQCPSFQNDMEYIPTEQLI